jgi:predicted Zn finger-like uncharacterized protein
VVIECSSCHARFKLADDKIKETGTKVRCTKCHEVFTVFPESPSPITPPTVAPQKEVHDTVSFAGTDLSLPSAEMPHPPAGDVPAKEADEWYQDPASDLPTSGTADEAGTTDLDAISFKDIESPVFSVTNEEENKFAFSDDTAFSFSDFSFEGDTDQPYKINAATGEQPLSGERENNFEADFSSPATAPPTIKDLNQFNAATTTDEFNLSGADNLADFSWNEPDTTPIAASHPEKTQETGTMVQDTAFDFSSFSFDDADDAKSASIENDSNETVAQSESTIKLSLATGTESAPVETRLSPREVTPSPAVREHQESTPHAARPLHPRVRPKKKSSSRLIIKIFFLFLLALAATYGVMNRELILKVYNNVVSSFIENQSLVETSGRIGLVKLSGSYVFNSQEGDLFVIRGEAVNEFKDLRSSVLVRGTLYGDNGMVLQSQSAYSGNSLPDSSLKDLGFKEIRDVMSNELGENLVNLNIAMGKGIPFMIVFNKIPDNIKEFTVEVLESKPGSK